MDRVKKAVKGETSEFPSMFVVVATKSILYFLIIKY